MLSFDWNEILSNWSLQPIHINLKSRFYQIYSKKEKINTYSSPWYNKRLNNLKNKKNKSFKRYRRDTSNVLLKSSYLYIQNEFNVLNKFLFNLYMMQTVNNLQSNSIFFWFYVNSKRKSNSLPNSIYLNDIESSDSYTICEMFAEYFSSVFTNDAPTFCPTYDCEYLTDLVS